MKAVVIAKQGTPVAPNVQVVDDWPDPTAAPGNVLVKTEASALNHLDLWIGRGLPGLDFDYPRITGSDGCGTIEAVGAGVDESWMGKRVVVNAAVPQPQPELPEIGSGPGDIRMIGEHDPGTMAEKFVAPVTNVACVGDAEPTDAAAYALTHLTAWRMLISRAQLRAGQTVLITGIGGGVALACLNIARHFGCKTVVTSRHQSKLDKAADLGATHGILDTGEDWSRQVRQVTSKQGADVCADSIGKAVHLSCIKSLARGGVFVTCGCTTGPDATTDLARMFWNQCSIMGSTMGDMDEFRQAISLLNSGAIKPVVDSVHDANDAAKAYERLESGDQFGKVVIRWG
ncbi:MAG: zinc-binding dehydrogenase [Planctomycetes bacterium]|nr:zinc-binding dehydrogenase [Planctomycetota bacterium]